MTKLRVSTQAQDDLLEIWEYFAEINPKAAQRLLQTLKEKFLLLLDHPLIGRERNDLLLGLRAFPVGKYLVFYQPLDDGIEIVRVRHAASDYKGMFDI
jgi:toxin ParE1/3/4